MASRGENPLASTKPIAIKRAPPSDISDYTAEQIYIAHKVIVEKRNCLINGAGGTGKTWLSRELIARLYEADIPFLACAATGVAAQLLGGVTAYQACGLSPKKEYNPGTHHPTAPGKKGHAGGSYKAKSGKNCVQGITLNPTWAMKDALVAADVIIMDEISMFSGALFAAMDQRCRRIRKRKDEPFGGMQIVCVGDVCQLPPVEGEYCFQTELFKKMFDRDCCFKLVQQMRQRGDPIFASILNAVRRGSVSREQLAILNERVFANRDLRPDVREVPYLFTTNKRATEHNDMCMKLFTGREVTWPIVRNAAAGFEFLLDKFKDEVSMTLKVGAPVFLTRNFDVKKNLVNGTRGVVIDMIRTCSMGLNPCRNPRCPQCAMGEPIVGHKLMKFEDDTFVALGPALYPLFPLVEFNGDRSQRYVVLPSVNAITRPAARKPRAPKPTITKTEMPAGPIDGEMVSTPTGGAKRNHTAMASAGGKTVMRVKQSTLSFGQSPQSASSADASSSAPPAMSQASQSPYFSSMTPAASSSSSQPTDAVTPPSSQPSTAMAFGDAPVKLDIPHALQCAAAMPVQADTGADDYEQAVPLSQHMLTILSTAIGRAKAKEQKKAAARETVLAYTESVPLMLACGITVHKSQGMTYKKVAMDISEAFAEGQAYVALSRVTCLEGLYLLSSVPERAIRCSPHALECEDYCIVAKE